MTFFLIIKEKNRYRILTSDQNTDLKIISKRFSSYVLRYSPLLNNTHIIIIIMKCQFDLVIKKLRNLLNIHELHAILIIEDCMRISETKFFITKVFVCTICLWSVFILDGVKRINRHLRMPRINSVRSYLPITHKVFGGESIIMGEIHGWFCP